MKIVSFARPITYKKTSLRKGPFKGSLAHDIVHCEYFLVIEIQTGWDIKIVRNERSKLVYSELYLAWFVMSVPLKPCSWNLYNIRFKIKRFVAHIEDPVSTLEIDRADQ